MRNLKRTLAMGIMASGLCCGSALAADEQCVRVIGYEWDGEKQTADPALSTSTDSFYHMYNIYEGLVDVDNSWQPIPRLAESWETNEDATEWTFKLRQGVKFHDGSDFTSADVVHTYRRLLDPQLASPAVAVLSPFLTPEGIEAVDAHTVRFKLTKPIAEFPVLQRDKMMQIVKDGTTAEELRVKGVGTGPFVLEQFTPGAPVRILRRNENYWQPGVPKTECVRVTVIQEATSRLAAMLSGEADVLLNVDAASLVSLKDNPVAELVSTPGATGITLAMWIDTPPFDDVRVREAMKLVVDRQAMLDTVVLGFGELGNDTPVPPSSPVAFRSDVPQQDIAKAKELLAEAGYADGLSIDLYTGEFYPGTVLFAQSYAEMASEAGIKVNLINTPADSFWDQIWLQKPLFGSAWGARSPALALSVAYRTGAAWNETRWARADYDSLLDKANGTLDAAERKRLLGEAQRLLATEGGLVLPIFASVVSALRKGCTGFQPHIQVSYVDFRELKCE